MKVIVSGASGRMGQAVQDILKEKKHQFVAGLAQTKKDNFFVKTKDLPAGADVVIDFSLPENFSQLIKWCVETKTPLVSGTTGLTQPQKKQMQQAAKKIPVLWAPNMSIGITLLKMTLEQMVWPKDFDIQVTEYHHSKKKDRPSGTAILLQNALQKKNKVTNEPISIRGGGIFGIHRVDFMSNEEVITIEHTALSRAVFAKGAVCAAEWLIRQKPGVYSMENVVIG